MRHAMVTVAARIDLDRIDQALKRIETYGNPATRTVADALDRLDGEAGVHFVSLHAFPSADQSSPTGHLVLEFSADGEDAAAIARVADRMEDVLRDVFSLAKDWSGGPLAPYLTDHVVTLGQGWFGRSGLPFDGTPGMSVGRIRAEAALAEDLAEIVGAQDGGLTALGRLDAIRRTVGQSPENAWALGAPPSLASAPRRPFGQLIGPLVWQFARTYLWPLALPVAAVLIYGAYSGLMALGAIADAHVSLPFKAWLIVEGLWHALVWALKAFLAFAIPVSIVLAAIYLRLRRHEQTDWIDDRAPQRAVLGKILANENQYAQNHMISLLPLKAGVTRMATLRFAFWLIAELSNRFYPAGHLGQIGTIHFARWVTLPGSRDFVFFSNFGGSWESYLEDFITRAHYGLTAVWSNAMGFPRSENLFQKGATDGERFKRYARRSMLPTPFWYSAYPTLTADNVRTNAAIRCGLAAAATDEEAAMWLALFGSAARPAGKLESNQIQSIIFGGLGFMPCGTVMIVDLDRDGPATRGWLGELLPEIAFDDGRRLRRNAVVTLALGPEAFAKAGLPAEALETFPAAFLDGMADPGRVRILGDRPDADDPDRRWWWPRGTACDAAILVYGDHDADVAALGAKVTAMTEGYGHRIVRTMPLQRVPNERSDRREAFSFVDGTSQPVIRGTYRGMRNADPIHLVEPGEFILGYPDNRGNVPPGPTLGALNDPENLLPIRCDGEGGFGRAVVDAERDIGRNGSFLVIRQLEQDPLAFWAYCEREAERLADRLPAPYVVDAEFIAAKMIGRWRNGSSLARNPYRPYGQASDVELNMTRRTATNPADLAQVAPPPSASPKADETPPSSLKQGVTTESAEIPPARRRARGGHEQDNDFLLGMEDPQGLRCPFGAHIRRANPRDSLEPGSLDQIEITNRHRILRVGRNYAPQEGEKPGLMFMCLNGDLERQFEFVQQTWLNSRTFHGLSGEADPIAGAGGGLTIPTRDGPVRLKPVSDFVTLRGGGYFFLPGRRLLEFLSDQQTESARRRAVAKTERGDVR